MSKPAKVYIAGPITGHPDYKQVFENVQRNLEAAGSVAINPAILPEGLSPGEYMAICLPMLLSADRVLFLHGWETSKGAMIEHALALYAGKEIGYV